MRHTPYITLCLIALLIYLAPATLAADDGQAIAFDARKGNCLACHAMAGAENAGTIGPELKNIQAKFPNAKDLKALLWDASSVNPNTVMPPYGKHRILTEQDIEALLEFLYTL